MWKYYEIYSVSIKIYAGSYKYLKEKKKDKRKTNKKKKKATWTNQSGSN